MTDDIAELVRDLRIWQAKWQLPPEHVCVQAADTIERLQAERDQAREQLEMARSEHHELCRALDAERDPETSRLKNT